MPLRQLLLYRRFPPPFIVRSVPSFPFQATRSTFEGTMKTAQQLPEKTLASYQISLPHNLKESSLSRRVFPHLASSHKLRKLSTQRLLTLHHQPFGSLQKTPFSLLQSLRSCGRLPIQELVGKDAVHQSDISSPTMAGDVMEEVCPSLHHSSSFLQLFLPKDEGEEVNNTYALVILNHDLPLLTQFLWSKACCRICADGGANRIYDCIPSLFPHEDPIKVRQRYKPDVIKGDLDSIRPEVKEFYFGLGTKIMNNSEDQDTNDLWKCVAYAIDSMHDIKKGHVKLLVLGALGGRLDHEFANMNTLYLFREVRIILLTDQSMAFLLPKGYKHEIIIDSSVEGPYCGLLPLGCPSLSTTTTGLKWDLNETSMQFGGLISTSNTPISDRVTVTSDTDLVWTISLDHLHTLLKKHVGSVSKVSS